MWRAAKTKSDTPVQDQSSQCKSPKVIAERMGHSSITITMDTYSHVLPTMQQAATNKLEVLLWKSGKPLANSAENEKEVRRLDHPLTPFDASFSSHWEAGIRIQPQKGSH